MSRANSSLVMHDTYSFPVNTTLYYILQKLFSTPNCKTWSAVLPNWNIRVAAMLVLLIGNQVQSLVPYSGIMFLPRCMNSCLLAQNYYKGQTQGSVPYTHSSLNPLQNFWFCNKFVPSYHSSSSIPVAPTWSLGHSWKARFTLVS
jgi:hypothetical protein